MARQQPTADWDEKKLANYAGDCYRNTRKPAIARRKAIDLFRAGHALWLLNEKLKDEKKWNHYTREAEIPRTTAHHLVKLYTHFGTEEKIEGMGIMEAKRAAGLSVPGPKPPPTVPANSPKELIRFDRAIQEAEKALIGCKEAAVDWSDDRKQALERLAAELARITSEAAEVVGSKPKRTTKATAKAD